MSRPDYIGDVRTLLLGNVKDENNQLIPNSDILISWRKKKINFPCIVITKIGGTDLPQLGGGWSKSRPIISIDAAASTSAYTSSVIINNVKDILLQNGYEMTSEFMSYDTKYETYIFTINVRLTSTYSFV